MAVVLNIAKDDFANFSHDNANALRSVGVKCDDVKYVPHVFEYRTQSRIVNEKGLKQAIEKADIIQIMHSDASLLKHCKGKRIVVYHTGTRYRQNPEKYNKIFNPQVERSFIALGEFSGLGAKNETYIVGAIKTNQLIEKDINVYCKTAPLFMHLPSNPDVKGSFFINQVMDYLAPDYFYSDEKKSHQKQLETMSKCDIYVEMDAKKQEGKPYGSWGITALEAAALGKVVITNHLTVALYKETYGTRPPFLLSEQYGGGLMEVVNHIKCMSHSEIRNMMLDHYHWVNAFHSFEATGKRLKKILGI